MYYIIELIVLKKYLKEQIILIINIYIIQRDLIQIIQKILMIYMKLVNKYYNFIPISYFNRYFLILKLLLINNIVLKSNRIYQYILRYYKDNYILYDI